MVGGHALSAGQRLSRRKESVVSVTVEKALQLVEALSKAGGPVGVSQLGRELDLNKTTVFRLLATLMRRGYVRQDPDSGRYALSVKLWELGIGVVQRLDLRAAARVSLEGEAKRTGESTLLGVVQDREALIIDKVDSWQALQIHSRLGTRVPLCSSSLGRALLAFQPEPFIEDVTARFSPPTSHGAQTREDVLRELDAIRRDGVASAIDEWQIGVAGVAAPIRNAGGAVVGSFCITGPTSRLGPERLPELQSACIDAAKSVSMLLGQQG